MITDHPKTRQLTSSEPIKNDQPNQNTSNKKCKKYFMIDAQTKIYFNADFDSGNLQKVQQISPYIYRLCPGYDKVMNTTEKTFFHFKVFGFRMCTVRFHINRVHILEKLLRSKQQQSYRPVVKKGKGKYEPLNKGVKLYYNRSDQAQLSIQYEFDDEDIWTYFAFTFPYPYQQMLALTKQLKFKFANHSEIYFHEEVLGYSQQGRKMEKITITERINCSKQKQQSIEGIFPQRGTNPPPFLITKPKIIISGRVHPGQTPSSYCIQGLLRFLLDQKDYRAYLLRRNFHFIIVPMLNPDGVYHGLFRNDINGDNLNRVYVNCSKTKHPTIWCFKEYLKYLQSSSQPVIFYFDFHAHPSRKQFFIYGNAFNQFTHQAEAQTFGKLLQNNCPYFHNVDSIFTEKQMSSKDKYDVFSKEGCGRVYVHKLFNIIHSYTVQCGYFAPGKLQKWQPVQSILKKCQVLNQQYQYVSSWEKCSTKTYTIQSYMLMGKSILVTVLDLFHLNPYTRINLNQLRSISTIRKNVGIKIYNCVERFRLTDANVTKKIKQLTKILQQEYYKVKIGVFGLSISQNYGMKHPKRTFSLLSRVYLSKKDFKIQLENQFVNDFVNIEEEGDENVDQQPQEIQVENERNLFIKQTEYVNSLEAEAILHSHNFQQYKSQLQLKMPKFVGSNRKIQQKYLSEVGHECLHVSKLASGPPTHYSSRNELSQSENTSSLSKIRQIEQKLNIQSVKDTKNRQKRSGSEKSLNSLRFDNKIAKRNGTQQKVQMNPYSWSQEKKGKQLKISQIQKRLEVIAQIKSSRLDSFLKKQSQKFGYGQITELQKNIVQNMELQSGKVQTTLSRFPSLYSKYLQGDKKTKR